MTFSRQGFTVISNVLSESELVLARELVAHLVERHRAGDQAVVAESVSVAAITSQYPQRNPGVVSSQVEQEPYIIGNLVSLDPRFAKIFSVEALWVWAGELLGCASEDVVFHFSNVTRKPSFKGPAVGWHRDADNIYFAALDRRTLRFLLPLQPMSKVNGGTEVVAGSHLPDAAAQTVESGSLVCCPSVVPGSCLVLHSEVLHGGVPNRSSTERDVIVLQFGVATSELRHQGDEVLSLSDRKAFLRFSGSSPWATPSSIAADCLRSC
jgi:Phytanoyl-CoA dioxygenase (PhyH)